jgi:hypothetical protein
MPPAEPAHSEVSAIGMVERALEPLTPEERGRVLRWATDRYGSSPGSASPRRSPIGQPTDSGAIDADDPGEFYAQASPETEPERALVIAYWVQEVEGRGEFDSQSVNTKLKHLGHGVSNITRVLSDLKHRKPQLVIQIEKAGKSKQARKRYRITTAGKAEVQRMLAATDSH